MWLATSRLSPFSSSLLSSASPAQLPALPTLAELQKHAEHVKTSVAETVQSLTDTKTAPVIASTKRPSPVVAISRSVRQPVRPTGVDYAAPPPPYRSFEDEGMGFREYLGGQEGAVRDVDPRGGRRLKKGKVGWRRIQGEKPGHDMARGRGKDAEAQRGTWWDW